MHFLIMAFGSDKQIFHHMFHSAFLANSLPWEFRSLHQQDDGLDGSLYAGHRDFVVYCSILFESCLIEG